MEIITHTTRGTTKASIEVLNDMTTTFAKALRLESSCYCLQLYCMPNLLRDFNRKGAVTITGNRQITALIDSKLLRDKEALATVLAHEMVHVKQFVKGQLVQKKGTGNHPPKNYWMGKLNKKSYFERPWELEAFGRQQILANMVAV